MEKVKTLCLVILFAALHGYCQEIETDKPNVVFIISDQHKLDAIGAYGNKLSITPNIDKLVKTGVSFTNAYTPSPVCAPARASLITGMYPYANGAIYHKAPITMPNGKIKNMGSGYLRETGYNEGILTLGDVFREQNYRTAAPGKMHVHGELQKNIDDDLKEGNDIGFDESSVRYYTHFPGGHYADEVGEDTYMRYRQFKKYNNVYNKGSMHLNEDYVATLVLDDEDNFDMVVAKKSVEFINKQAEEGQQFFLHVGFEKPHAPFTTTRKYLDMHSPSNYQLPETSEDWLEKGKYPWVPNWVHSGMVKDTEKAQNVMAAYNACVTEMDDMVGRVVQALKDNGLYENTIIIYTTDHGEHLFEHGLRGKHNMYEAAVNVPFIISYPKHFQQNVSNNTAVSFVDIMPTLSELIKGKTPVTAQGISLVEILTKGTEIKDRAVFSEFRGADYNLLPGIKNVPSRMMRKGDYKFIYTHGIIDQLYNIKDDPNELDNLIFKKEFKTIHKEMYFQTLADWVFPEYTPLDISIQGDTIIKPNYKAFKEYSIFYSEENEFSTAVFVQDIDMSDNTFKMDQQGYYWVLAIPALSKTSKFYGNNIPVAVDEYSYTLPISKAIAHRLL